MGLIPWMVERETAISDVFTGWLDDEGPTLFPHIPGVEFITEETAGILDQMYVGAHSGEKIISTLLSYYVKTEKWDNMGRALAQAYGPKWNQLYRQFSDLNSGNILDNINMTRSETLSTSLDRETTGSRKENEQKTDESEKSANRLAETTGSDERSEVQSGGRTESETESKAHTRDGTIKDVEQRNEASGEEKKRSGTDTLTDSGAMSNTNADEQDDYVFGFNSTTNVPRGRNTSRVTNSETSDNYRTTDYGSGESTSGTRAADIEATRSYDSYKETDSTTREKSVKYDDTTTDISGSNSSSTTTTDKSTDKSSANRLAEQETSGNVHEARSESTARTYTGYQNINRIDQLMKVFDPNTKLSLLDIVFDDIDQLLTIGTFR